MPRSRLRLAAVAVLALSSLSLAAHAAEKNSNKEVEHGKYLVTIMTCNDCHTAGALLGKPDMAHFLGGSNVGFEIPGMGVFYGPNLTPDKETGLGSWTSADIVKALQTGVTPQGRQLAPVMPYHNYVHLAKADAYAIAAYLKSLPAVKNQVPGPFGPTETPTSFVMKVVPPAGAAPAK
jgi:mono/diheme cytochrome c family protein